MIYIQVKYMSSIIDEAIEVYFQMQVTLKLPELKRVRVIWSAFEY